MSLVAPRYALRRLAGDLVELLLPQRCVVCGRFGAALHATCIAALPGATPPRCGVCWAPLASATFDRCERCAEAPRAVAGLRAPYRLTGAVRTAVLEAKFRGVTQLLEPLAGAAAAVVPRGWELDAVIAVPLHPRRARRRGYDQAELIARTVARRLELPLEAAVLRRRRSTPPQAGLGAADRATNLRDAFVVAGAPPRVVLLVDDVTTTGSTFEAAAQALRAAGTERVYALALARED